MADDQPAPEVKTSEKPARNGNTGRRLRSGALAGNGRPKGRLNQTTLIRHAVGKALLRELEGGIPDLKVPPAAERWAKLILHRSGQVRYMTEKYLHEALHGKPRQQLDVNATFRGDPMENLRRAAAAANAMREGRLGITGQPEAPVIDVRLLPEPGGNGNGNGGNGTGHK